MKIESMKAQRFGVEVEMNNIRRDKAAMLAAGFFGTCRYKDTAARNGYCTWQINDPDAKALFAVSRGIDGWKGNTWGKTYRMIVNRGAITVSSQDKSIHGYWNSGWKAAPNA